MGLIRKSLYLGTGGLVSPNSKKQRLLMQQLAALQGATPDEVRRRGGRSDYEGFFGFPPEFVSEKRVRAGSSGTLFRPCEICEAPVRRIKGRNWDANGFEHACPGAQQTPSPEGNVAGDDGQSEAIIQLSCGHTASTTVGTDRGLSDEDESSSYCHSCGVERSITIVGSAETTGNGDVGISMGGHLADELERLARLRTSGALTETEFKSAKARLLGT